MDHNPEKSQALCVVAKSIYWPLRVLGWLNFIGALFVMIGMAVRDLTPLWSGWANLGRALLLFVIFILVFVAPITAVVLLYNWAKKYRQDC